MFQPFQLGLFLYFPKDKSEYIPAVISLVIFMILAFLTMLIIVKVSKREAQKAKELEDRLKHSQTMQKNS